jgi:aspartyl-tRNA(Asn)/glutamyl-tRNA(Gln) amidotransferase subunit C
MTTLSVEDIRKVAYLARLELSDAETETLAPQFLQILTFIEQLGELDTEHVEPMTTALDVTNRWADDVIEPGLSSQQALAAAPASDGEYFLVPPVLGTAAT